MLKIDKDQLLEIMINEAREAIDNVVRTAFKQPTAQAWTDNNVAAFEKEIERLRDDLVAAYEDENSEEPGSRNIEFV